MRYIFPTLNQNILACAFINKKVYETHYSIERVFKK